MTPRTARCTFDSLPPELARATAERMLGLHLHPDAFEQTFTADPLLGPLILHRPGLRIPLTATPWEGLAWAIMGQQISLTIAIALRRRLILLAGQPRPDGLRAHPGPDAVAALSLDDLRALKFSRSKAEYLLSAARALASGELDLDALRQQPPDVAAARLCQLRGIGPWTAEYTALRALGFPDSLPAGDAGIAQALARLTGTRPDQNQIRELTARYAPHRSLVAAHLWASLNA